MARSGRAARLAYEPNPSDELDEMRVEIERQLEGERPLMEKLQRETEGWLRETRRQRCLKSLPMGLTRHSLCIESDYRHEVEFLFEAGYRSDQEY